ncbi:MAG: ATP-binding protein, partial [Candidatus Krumholzibacteria bacterium]|nr:ATP-binding protein [Candidatus Krumholzibacteria bacterium]
MAPSDDKPFEPIHNPYIVGNPIRGTKMFFGREDDFAYVQSKITGGDEGGLIVLCGARRSGKTSILFQIQEGRLGEGFLPVLIDMQSMAITSDADFLGKVAQAIMTSGYEFSDSHLSTYFLEQKDNPYDAFDRFIKRLAEDLGDTKLVLTFDEYELFETNFDNNVLKTQVLRLVGNLIEHKRLFVVFTGSDKLEARNRKYWDILSKGLNRRISFLSRNDTLRLVREPLRGVIEYDQGVPEAIADLTAGQPFYTQVLCQTIVDHLNEEQKYDVNNEDLERVVNEVIVNPLPQMIFHWNQLPFLEKLCLSFIAEICRQESMPV